jgi:hypothetical protein
VWYKRDDNAVLPEYRPQSKDPNSEYADRAKWGVVEGRLHAVLAAEPDGADRSRTRRLVHLASATEQEIAVGGLQVETPEDKVFCFFRRIVRTARQPQASPRFISQDFTERQKHP